MILIPELEGNGVTPMECILRDFVHNDLDVYLLQTNQLCEAMHYVKYSRLFHYISLNVIHIEKCKVSVLWHVTLRHSLLGS